MNVRFVAQPPRGCQNGRCCRLTMGEAREPTRLQVRCQIVPPHRVGLWVRQQKWGQHVPEMDAWTCCCERNAAHPRSRRKTLRNPVMSTLLDRIKATRNSWGLIVSLRWASNPAVTRLRREGWVAGWVAVLRICPKMAANSVPNRQRIARWVD